MKRKVSILIILYALTIAVNALAGYNESARCSKVSFVFNTGISAALPTTVCLISGQSTAGQTQCSNGSFTPISVTATGTNLVYQWYSNSTANNSGGISLGADNGAQTNSYTPQTTNIGTTYYYCVVNGDCASPQTSAISGAFVVTQGSAGGSVSGNSQVCTGSTSGLMTLTGYTGSIVRWQYSVSPYSSWTNITNTTSTYTSGSLTESTKFRVVVKNGTCPNAISTPLLVTVNPLSVAGTVSSAQTICTGTKPANLTLSGNTGNVVRWEKSADIGFTTPVTIPGTSTTLTGITIGNLTTDTYFRAVVKSGECAEVNSSPVLISVIQTVGGSISGTTSVCSGTNSTLLTLSGYSGSIIKWQKTTDNWANTTDIVNTLPTYTATNLTITTKYRAVVKNGTCSEENSAVATVTVKANPAPVITGNIAVCENSTGNVYRTQIGMSNYTWTIPSGGVVTAGGGTSNNTVTLSWNTPGEKKLAVDVTASNNCSASDTLIVNVATGTVTNSNTGLRYCTISDAIDAPLTLDGHVLNVGPGINPEKISVNKSLSIVGDPGSSDPGPGPDAPVIDGTSLTGAGFKIENGVKNVLISGFEIRNLFSGLPVSCNGILAAVDSSSNITISHNYIHDVNSNGIHVSNFARHGDHVKWLVNKNIFEKFGQNGVKLVNTSRSIIEDNIIHVQPALNPESGITVYAFRNEKGITIRRNQIDGTFATMADTIASVIIGVVDSAGVPINSNIRFDSLYILNNTIQTTGSFTNIYITDSLRGFIKNVHVFQNSLSSLANNTLDTVTATANWWQKPDGPYHNTYNTCGSGDTVAGEVSFLPWYTNSSMTTLLPVFTAGSIQTTDETICYNGNPAEIASSVDATGGNGTTEYQWQKSVTGATTGFSDISGASSSSYDPPSGMTANTWYRRLARTSCYIPYTASTGVYKVEVYPDFTAGATETTGETICFNGNPGIIGNVTSSSGGDGFITCQWQQSTTDAVSGFADIASATASTFDPPPGMTATTWFRRMAHDGTCNTTFTAASGTWQTTVRPDFDAGEISATGETICYNGDPGNIANITGAGGGDGNISYQWQKSTVSSTTNFSNIGSATGSAYDPPSGLTTTTWYRRLAKDATCNTVLTSSAGVWKVTVYDNFSAGSISATGESICYNGDPGNISNSVAAGGGDESVFYQWQKSTTDAGSSFADISGATESGFNPPPGLTNTTWYRRLAKDGTCEASFSTSAGTWKVFVHPAGVGGTISGDTVVCYGNHTSLLTLSGHTGTVRKWQYSTNGTNWVDLTGQTSTTYTATNLITNTWYRVEIASGDCPEVYSSVHKIRVFSNYKISGYANYENNPKTPLSGLKITLKKDGSAIGSPYTTGATGFYEFNGLVNGTYSLEISSAAPGGNWQTWGGVNNTDALVVNNHILGITPLATNPPVIKVTASVKLPHPDIDNADYLAIRQAAKYPTTGYSYFSIPKWVFSGATYETRIDTILLACADVYRSIRGLCAGDVNGTYVPASGFKAAESSVELLNAGKIPVSGEMVFPVVVHQKLELSAISLFLNYDQRLVEITGVDMPVNGGTEPWFMADNGFLNIGWMSSNPVYPENEQTLLLIHTRLNQAFRNTWPGSEISNLPADIRFSLTDNLLSELADANADIIPDVKLTMPVGAGAENAQSINVKNRIVNVFPNPAKNKLYVEYLAESETTVRVEILNLQGISLLTDQKSVYKGQLSRESIDISDLAPGVYMLKVVCDDVTEMRKIIVNR